MKEPRWPMPVHCYGRRYLVTNDEDLQQLLQWLTERRIALANRFRIGASWPRGEQSEPVSRAKWKCRDCDCFHRWNTERCTVSYRLRERVELV